jgi:alpha-beta hydrolase superfamily lysophospholipase
VALLLHGLGYHSGSYPALLPAFVGARYKVVALDFAGFGASPGERGAGGALAMADAIETLCRRIEAAEGTREISIVAHSMGAVAALLFLKRYPARRIRFAAVSPLLFGVPVDASPEALAEDEEHKKKIAEDPRYAASMPNSLAADLDRTAKELLGDPSFLEGRKAAFFVGEDDPLVPLQRLKESVAALPLKEARVTSFPRERHDPIGGRRGDQVAAAILSWLDETKFEYR